MSLTILGVRFDTIDRDLALEKVRQFLIDKKRHVIFTPNPEMLVDAQKNQYFKDVLNASDLNLCDGKGVELVSLGKLKRIPGVDFMIDICSVAAKEGKTVYLLGSGDEEVLEKCAKRLEIKNSKLKIIGSHPGLPLSFKKTDEGKKYLNYDEMKNDAIIDDIIEKAPDILFVAFGHEKQELWMYEQLPHLPSVKLAMGVGGSFDYIAGKVKRAPKLVRKLGLEWVWRLVRQPWRVRRIWKATVIFLFTFLKYRVSK